MLLIIPAMIVGTTTLILEVAQLQAKTIQLQVETIQPQVEVIQPLEALQILTEKLFMMILVEAQCQLRYMAQLNLAR